VNPIRVMIVDDHTVVRDGLCMLLSTREHIEVMGVAAARAQTRVVRPLSGRGVRASAAAPKWSAILRTRLGSNIEGAADAATNGGLPAALRRRIGIK